MKHVVEYKKYQELKKTIEVMKTKLGNPDQRGSNEDMQEDNGENVEADLETVNEESIINRSFNDEEESNEITFIKGNRGAKNPGKIIVGNRQQLICNRIMKREERTRYFYDCARKHEGKSKGKGESCKARIIVETNEVGEEVEVIKLSKLTDHNHVCDEARVVKWLIQAELEDEMLKDILQRASHVRKKVICAFQQKIQ